MARGKSARYYGSKKRKTGGRAKKRIGADDPAYKRAVDPKTWVGWVEFESDPAYFDVMVRELGVSSIRIREIMTLDDASFDELEKPVHAFIFSYQYRESDTGESATTCPDHIWFAEQSSDFSCASVALMNIINNIPSLDRGHMLQGFRDMTADLSPADRGRYLNGFAELRAVHNSFAYEMDILEANVHMAEKKAKEAKAEKTEQRRKAKDAEEAQRAAEHDTTLRRSGRKRKVRALDEVDGDDDDDVEEAEAGYHYVAILPIGNEVWKLDGMDGAQLLGSVNEGEDWVMVARRAIAEHIGLYSGEEGHGQLTFNLLAVVHSAYQETSRRLQALSRRSAEGGQAGEGASSAAEEMEIRGLEASIAEEEARRAMDDRKAELRRFDPREMLGAWVEALKEEGILGTLNAVVKGD